MVKDYFQDIVPPEEEPRPRGRAAKRVPISKPPVDQEEEMSEEVPDVGLVHHDNDSQKEAGRSIRNIAPSRERIRLSEPREAQSLQERFSQNENAGGRRSRSRYGLWLIAGVLVLVLGLLGLFAFRKSSITVTPKMQAVTFDETSHLGAYPETAAATGTLSYKIISIDLEDSEPVSAQGMKHTETKSSGSVTVYNSYATTPVRLIKNTRFKSADGLIYRTPADVLVPGKKGTTPGSVSVTVVADKAGAEYNVAPTDFTLPGLESNAAMFKGVYAKSSAAFSGGFVGEQPAVEPATLAGAISAVRSRLGQKSLEASKTNEAYMIFPDLAQVTYQSLPSTTEAGGGVRIHEKAHVDMIAFPKELFAKTVAKTVSADAENASIELRPGEGFAARTATPPANWGSQMIDFSLMGQAVLVWNIDTAALANALANRHESAFQTVVTAFPGIQEAHARIQPFWKSTFPDSSKIIIKVVEPVGSAE
jgi:hypothetical protein